MAVSQQTGSQSTSLTHKANTPLTPRGRMPMYVLLVDDNELVRVCLADVLRDAGMQVVDLADPREALALPNAVGPPAVLVTDVNLGCDLDGFALAAAARQRWPSLLVLFISGMAGNFSGSRLLPCDRYLLKPFDGSDLLRAIHGLTEGSHRAARS